MKQEESAKTPGLKSRVLLGSVGSTIFSPFKNPMYG